MASPALENFVRLTGQFKLIYHRKTIYPFRYAGGVGDPVLGYPEFRELIHQGSEAVIQFQKWRIAPPCAVFMLKNAPGFCVQIYTAPQLIGKVAAHAGMVGIRVAEIDPADFLRIKAVFPEHSLCIFVIKTIAAVYHDELFIALKHIDIAPRGQPESVEFYPVKDERRERAIEKLFSGFHQGGRCEGKDTGGNITGVKVLACFPAEPYE